MLIIGYGEDGLTYLALTDRLDQLLSLLEPNNPCPSSQCLAFYRPSFGRAGGPNSPQFGEFDAILATKNGVYLIESKWDGSPCIDNDSVLLADRQIQRHQHFRAVRGVWSHLQVPRTWDALYNAHPRINGRLLAPTARRLANNFERILIELNAFQMNEIDVLLYFHRVGGQVPTGVADEHGQHLNFTLVCMAYETINEGGLFMMNPPAQIVPEFFERMNVIRIPIDEQRIVCFCRRYHIERLSLFGSVLRDDFGPESDVDVLVEFEPGHTPGWDFFGIQDELTAIIGRQVDLNTPKFLSRYFRDEVVAGAMPIYESRRD